QRMNPDFEQYGLRLNSFLVENISLPPNVEQALDKRSSMGIIGNLNQYTQFQAANALEQAAKNPGGDASAGIGMGMGFAMANQMGQVLNQDKPAGQNSQQQVSGATPPPLPAQSSYFVAIGGEQVGPFFLQAFKQKIMSNEIDRNTLVWTQGMPGWLKADEVDELKPLFASVPPPLPPSSSAE
ncbi:Putative virion core protein (lumpy skin disease virus), partial [hydrothermal vent metagenome]